MCVHVPAGYFTGPNLSHYHRSIFLFLYPLWFQSSLSPFTYSPWGSLLWPHTCQSCVVRDQQEPFKLWAARRLPLDSLYLIRCSGRCFAFILPNPNKRLVHFSRELTLEKLTWDVEVLRGQFLCACAWVWTHMTGEIVQLAGLRMHLTLCQR